jgi:hypothetical protein
LRGVNAGPEELASAAAAVDGVYLSDYLPDGGLSLRRVGRIRPAPAEGVILASVGDAVALSDAELVRTAAGLSLRLTWRCLGRLDVNDTIFVHFWRDGTFAGSADGDSLGELVPPYAWAPGTEIEDVRPLSLEAFEPGRYEVRVGLYNRASGLRYATADADGVLMEFGALVGSFNWP